MIFVSSSRVQLRLSALLSGPPDGRGQRLFVVQSSKDVAPGGPLRPRLSSGILRLARRLPW